MQYLAAETVAFCSGAILYLNQKLHAESADFEYDTRFTSIFICSSSFYLSFAMTSSNLLVKDWFPAFSFIIVELPYLNELCTFSHFIIFITAFYFAAGTQLPNASIDKI